MNAPVPKLHVSVEGSADKVKTFEKNTKPRFPKTANYSFDFGSVHVVCLDANLYANPLDPAIVEWLKADLKNTRADWKLVAFHHPGFNTGKSHYNDQQMRLLSPLFEQHSVDLVLTGHVHNYQRSMPLRFSPKTNASGDQYLITEEGRVDGTFRIDTLYDGVTRTKPEGIIYIVTGSGGAALYDAALTNAPEQWKQAGDENWAPFTKKFISDIHSFTLIETEGGRLRLDQVDLNGNVLDSITITK
jgi:3',5'-cyclic AMP phosphodiesterase CpdA